MDNAEVDFAQEPAPLAGTRVQAPAAAVELQLLGRPGLRAGGRDVDPGARKALALLAWLALSGPATRARLATLFWPDLDAASARRNLRRELHRLRSAGVAQALQMHADGLALAPGVAVDAQVFESALARGDTAAALALYRGPLLDGFDLVDGGDFDPWARAERERLALRHREAVLATAAGHEAAGRLREALALCLRLIELDTLHEQHYTQAMRLHAALGERESALRVFERCRSRLAAELGLRPMPQTLALAESIRSGAPAEAADAPAAGTLPSVSPAAPPLVGREGLLAELCETSGAGRETWLLGEAGIGKTRLAQEAATRSGAFMVFESLAEDALSPWATATRALGRRWQPEVAASWPAWVREELSRLLPARLPGQTPPTGAVDLPRLRAAVRTAWRSLHGTAVKTTVFDDWHLADAQTRSLWPPGQLPGPGRVLVTLRPAECEPALSDALRRAAHDGECRCIELPPLDSRAVGELAQALAGVRPAPARLQQWQAATGGNPFFLIEVLRRADPARLAGDEPLAAPPSLHDALMARLMRLDESTRRLLELASLSGDRFDADELVEGTALTALERVQSVEQALAHQVLQRADDGRLRFRHQLLADALAAHLSPERRRLLHASLAAVLERLGAPPARIGRHLEAAGQREDALRWTLLAVQAAERLAAHDEALTACERALALCPPGQAAALHLHRARVLQRASRPEAVDAALDEAERAALQLGDGEFARQVLLARADHWVCSSRVDDGVALVDGLLQDGVLSPLQQAEALEVRGDALLRRGELAAAERALREALARLPAGVSLLRARLQLALARNSVYQGQTLGAADLAARAARAYVALGEAEGAARATCMQGAAELHAGRNDQALRLLRRARELAAASGSVPVQRAAILNLVKLLTQTGDLAQARALMDEGEALSPFYESRTAEAAFVQARYYTLALQGERQAARALIPRVLAASDACEEAYWQAGARQLVVDLLLLEGDDTQAATLLAQAAACGAEAGELMRRVVDVKRAWAALLAGQAGTARALLDALGPLTDTTPSDAMDVRRHVEAGLALDGGDAALALQAVPDPAAAGTEEAKGLQWAMRVQAEARLAGVQAATRESAEAWLSSPVAPVLEADVLRRALAAADAGAPLLLR